LRFSRNVAVELRRISGALTTVPFLRILREWKKKNFNRHACFEVLTKIIAEQPAVREFLNPDTILEGGLFATDKLLYEPSDSWLLQFARVDTKTDVLCGFQIPDQHVEETGRLLREIAEAQDLDSIRQILPRSSEEVVQSLFLSDPREEWPTASTPGIYRREHASILVQSETTKLLIDPISMSRMVPNVTSVGLPQSEDRPNGILVTHSHADHWDIPTLLSICGNSKVPIIVPQVPKPTHLCPNFEHDLSRVGLTPLAPRWNETLTLGDIEIRILPFFGEQPSITEECIDPDVRNWGNCYRIDTPTFSATLLVDSGKDLQGTMADVLRTVEKDLGPCDFLLACMRDFRSPFEIGGLFSYFSVLRFDQLEKLWPIYLKGDLLPTTAGLKSGGIADLCEASKAKIFLPYAEGFPGIGKCVPAGPFGPSMKNSESEGIAILRSQLGKRNCFTRAELWSPGDGFTPSKNGLIRLKCHQGDLRG